MNVFLHRQDPSKLQEQLNALKGDGGFSKDDPKEWKLKTDAVGNGEALIRFLPAKTETGLPFVKLINHGFRNNGKWYINNCSSTHDDFQSCPVCKYISERDLYNTNKQEWQLIKRKTSYWANILVLKDPERPENNGKVFKFRFGTKIYEKILSMSQVNVELGEVPINVVCPLGGANFLLKCRKVDKHANYDASRFMQVSAIPNIESEEFQKYLIENMEVLEDLVAPSKFKPFKELDEQFRKVMGVSLVAGDSVGGANEINKQLDEFDEEMLSYNADSSTQHHKEDPNDFLSGLQPTTSGVDDMDDLDKLLEM